MMEVMESCRNSSPVAEQARIYFLDVTSKDLCASQNQDKAALCLPPVQTLDPGSSLFSVAQNYPILLLKTALRTLRKHLGFSLSTAFGKVTQLKEKLHEKHLS